MSAYVESSGGLLVPAGTERIEHARTKKARVRTFKGAQSTRFAEGWTTTPVSIDAILARQLRTLRGRSRVESRSSPYLRKFLHLLRVNVVGSRGVEFRPRVMSGPETEDGPATRALRRWYRRFTRKENCDFQRMRNMRALQNLVVTTLAREGEFCAEHVIDPSLPFGYAVRPFDPELIDVDLSERRGGNIIKLGVEYTEGGVPVAYHLRSTAVGSEEERLITFERRRVPVDRIMHIFVHDEVDQSRGIPETAWSLFSIKQLNEFSESAIVAAREGANKMGFYFTSDGAPVGVDEAFEDDDEELVDGPLETSQAGTFSELPPGTQFKEYDPSYPHEMYDPFLKRHLKETASALTVNYTSLASDPEGTNFSSMRGTVLEDRDAYMCRQTFLIDEFCQPVAERALLASILLGQVVTERGGRLNPNRIERYVEGFRWGPRRWDWVDPAKDAAKAQTLYELGAMSLTEICEQRGRTIEEVVEERKREQDMMAAAGVTPAAVLSTLAPEDDDEPDDNDDSEDDDTDEDE